MGDHYLFRGAVARIDLVSADGRILRAVQDPMPAGTLVPVSQSVEPRRLVGGVVKAEIRDGSLVVEGFVQSFDDIRALADGSAVMTPQIALGLMTRDAQGHLEVTGWTLRSMDFSTPGAPVWDLPPMSVSIIGEVRGSTRFRY